MATSRNTAELMLNVFREERGHVAAELREERSERKQMEEILRGQLG